MINDSRLEKKVKFLEYFRELPIQKLGAGFIGVCEDTIADWKKEDKDFSDQIELAKSEWARTKSKQVKSKEWLLERVMNEHFKEHKSVDVNLPTPLLGEDDVHQDNSTPKTTTTE